MMRSARSGAAAAVLVGILLARQSAALAPTLARRGVTTPLGLEHRLPIVKEADGVETRSKVWTPVVPQRSQAAPSTSDTATREGDRLQGGGPHPNVYHILDVLRDDYPTLFTREPDLSIYTNDIVVTDPTGVDIVGKTNYKRVWAGLRAMKRYAMNDAELRYSMLYCKSSNTVRVFWSVDVVLKPAIALYMGMGTRADPIRVDGISVYHINRDGLIFKHSVENLNYHQQLAESASALSMDMRAWMERVQRRHKKAWHTGHAFQLDYDRSLYHQLLERQGKDKRE